MPTGVYERTEKHKEIRLGKHYSPETEFKKGMIPWNKNKSFPRMIGNTNGFKKGHQIWKLRKRSYKGNKNPNWNGGGKGWWRQSILKRDNYTCQICGLYEKQEGFMDVDHMVPVRRNPELKYVISNGQTLCPNCHRRKTITNGDFSKRHIHLIIRGNKS